ncbi:putative membrane protein [Catalinimonas alkaloidigena]|uniref:hypothetical protein n=1 Tax=Catalinimonas alkaloidigena TaxID=1075417 RepID=UPI002404E964|nr:hypothetical protein [Catalinimonas alkaloidigena]MDF9795810.1 putative membrane protein [Catalinimonas alkaloidigena]
MADLDFFILAILVLFFQYLAVYLFIRLGGRWQPKHPLSFYVLAALVGTIGFSLIFSLFKWYFNYTFVSLNFEFARNCMGFAMFLMIGKIYGLMPMEFMVRHLQR